jgi:ParB-like chromosome segregation protein Spo0J
MVSVIDTEKNPDGDRFADAAPPSENGASTTAHLRDLTQDPENRRAHNPRNIGMIVDSLHRVGAGRSIVIDEDGVVLAGNGVVEAAAEAGIEQVRIIEASGNELIAVRRSGLTPEQKRHLALSDNRAAELATWNLDQLRADADAGLDLALFFAPAELADLLAADAPVPKFQAEAPARRLDELSAHCPTCTCREREAR